MMTMADSTGNAETPDEIRAALERMIGSDVFSRSPQLGAFLRFVVEAVLHGKADRIKAYTIGIEVLRRDPKFDPQLDPIVRWLWPIPVIGFVVYPYLKRFTWLCHFWLGAVDGLAPVGAWVAITGRLPWQSWMLGAAVAFWVAGFDCFYALFDEEIDRREGLHSIVTRFGVRGAFLGARLSHAATIAFLVAAGLGLPVGVLYWIGVLAVAALLAYEHSLVHPDDLRRLDTAFFTMNGVISVVFAGFVILDAVS